MNVVPLRQTSFPNNQVDFLDGLKGRGILNCAESTKDSGKSEPYEEDLRFLCCLLLH